MKMILIGYADEGAKTQPMIVAGPEVPTQKQAAIFDKAKRQHEYPEGIRRLEFSRVESADIAINLNQTNTKKVKPMKKILSILAMLAIVLLASNVNAQTYSAQSITVPSVLAAGTTNLASAPVLDVRRQDAVVFASTLNATSAGATNVYTFYKSIDGTYYDAANTVKVTNAPANATQKTQLDQITTTGFGYLKLYSIEASGTVTNTAHKYAIKNVTR